MTAEVVYEMFPWSNVDRGTRIRFTTPVFVKRGTVVVRKGRSLKVRFDGESQDTTLPDARWYHCEGQAGRGDENIKVIRVEGDRPPPQPKGPDSGGDLIPVPDATKLFGVDGKTIRRLLRSNRVAGEQGDSGQKWLVDSVSLGRWLAERR